MGAGYHGGFGATLGKRKVLKTGKVTPVKQDYMPTTDLQLLKNCNTIKINTSVKTLSLKSLDY